MTKHTTLSKELVYHYYDDMFMNSDHFHYIMIRFEIVT